MSSDIKIELQSARVIADGKEFGSVGCYEYLTGWIHFEIEPNSPLPTKIVDLENASKNEHGNVEYSSQIHILRPVDPTKSNRRLFLTMVTVVIRELSSISTMPLHPMNQFYQKNAATVFCLGEAIL